MSSKHLFLSTMAVLLGLSAYGFVTRSQNDMERMAQEAEGRLLCDEAAVTQAMADIQEAMSKSVDALRAGTIRTAVSPRTSCSQGGNCL